MVGLERHALETKALSGDAAARLALSRALELEERHDEALEQLSEAALAEHVPAMAILGARLMLGERCPLDPITGYRLVLDAANRGHAEACELAAALVATGVNEPGDFISGLQYLQNAAELGEPRARRQLILLSEDRELAGEARRGNAPAGTWNRLAAAVNLKAWLTPSAPKMVSQAPMIMIFEGFVPPALCPWLIERSRGMTVPARIYDNAKGGVTEDPSRSNHVALFRPPAFDFVIAILRAKIAAAVRMPPPALESFTVLHYTPGQRFSPHHDYLDPMVPGQAAALAEHGQRIGTFLAYLNTDFDGGETRFPLLNWSYRGGQGDAIFFLNIDPSGAPEKRSLHEGVATTRGEKWLVSQFVRNKPQPYDGAPPLVE